MLRAAADDMQSCFHLTKKKNYLHSHAKNKNQSRDACVQLCTKGNVTCISPKKKLLASHVKKNRAEMRACSCIRKASLRCHHGSAALWPSIAGLSSSASTGVSISYILLYYYSNNYYYTNNCSIVVSVLVV